MISYPLDFSRGSAEDYVQQGNFLNSTHTVQISGATYRGILGNDNNTSTNTQEVTVQNVGTQTDPVIVYKDEKEFRENIYSLLAGFTKKIRSSLIKNLFNYDAINNNIEKTKEKDIPVIDLVNADESESETEEDHLASKDRILKAVTQYSDTNKKIIDGQFRLLGDLELITALVNKGSSNMKGQTEHNQNGNGQQPVAVIDANRHEVITPEPDQSGKTLALPIEKPISLVIPTANCSRAAERAQAILEEPIIQPNPGLQLEQSQKIQQNPYYAPQRNAITSANNELPSISSALQQLQKLNTTVTANNTSTPTRMPPIQQSAGLTPNFSSYFGTLGMEASSAATHQEPARPDTASSGYNRYLPVSKRYLHRWERENPKIEMKTSTRGRPRRVKYTREEAMPYPRPNVNFEFQPPLPRFPIPPPIRPQPPPAGSFQVPAPHLNKYRIIKERQRMAWLAHIQAFPNATWTQSSMKNN